MPARVQLPAVDGETRETSQVLQDLLQAQSVKRILYIDAYDSFSGNIVDLLETSLDAVVNIKTIDDDLHQEEAEHYDAIVVGPGPGNPMKVEDVGCMLKIWRFENIPVLGICLGFQSMCHFYGAEVQKLPFPRHGRVAGFSHSGTDIFQGLPNFEVTLYHSLQVTLGHKAESSGNIPNYPECWESSDKCGDLIPLAWYRHDESPHPVNLMAVRHRSKPLWGVQFHPESCKSDSVCKDMIRNWWSMVQTFNRDIGRQIEPGPHMFHTRADLVQRTPCKLSNRMVSWCSSSAGTVVRRTLKQFELTAENICELVGAPSSTGVVLESNGKYSIISILSPGAWTLQYCASSEVARFERPCGQHKEEFPTSAESVDTALAYVLDKKRVIKDRDCVPFWGGFLGFFSYEFGLQKFGIKSPGFIDGEATSDMSLLWTERSIVIDRETGLVHIQSIRVSDDKWLEATATRLMDCSHQSSTDHILLNLAKDCPPTADSSAHLLRLKHSDLGLANLMVQGAEITTPSEQQYKTNIKACQNHIREGDSYELCLTGQTKVLLPPCSTIQQGNIRPWILYRRLRRYNPASFSGYLKIGKARVISSSPECFMNWDREGNFEMKPMKGTVKKGEGMTFAKAQEILNTPKEIGENLMIADLIRHDMSGITKSGGVTVHKLLEVEEHTRVYQMITHVKGTKQFIPPALKLTKEDECLFSRDDISPHSLRPLSHCLPPGSMTGAPKKRSCELLHNIEREKRSIYSGVMGYLDVGGAGSFNVLIRTAFSWSDSPGKKEIWRIGAGGAVTALSTPQGEWDEMLTKLNTVLTIFRPTPTEADAESPRPILQEPMNDLVHRAPSWVPAKNGDTDGHWEITEVSG